MDHSTMDINFRFRQLNKMQALTLCRELDSASYTEHSADEAGAESTVNEKNTKPRNYSALVRLTPENIEAITMFYVRQDLNLSQCDILINATLTNTRSFTLPVIVNQMLKHIDCPISFSVLN